MVKIPITIRIRKQFEKLGSAFGTLIPYADVTFHIGCIYATAIFFGASYGWKTILFAIGAYFLFFEAASEIRSILSVLSKR